MKILSAILFLFVAIAINTNGQTLGITSDWTQSFHYGNNGTSDQGHSIVLDEQGNAFISGANSSLNCGAIMKRDQGGNLLWSYSDGLVATLSGGGQIFLLGSKNKIGYFTSGAGGKNVVIRDATSGNLIQVIPKTISLNFAPYGVGDSVLAVETGSSDNIFVLDEYTNVGRTFPIGENVSGHCEIRVLGNYLWLVGQFLSVKAFVAKYNLATGQQIWRINVSDNMIQPRIDVDSLGNSYFACTQKDSLNFFYRFRSVKINSNGSIVWDKTNKPNQNWDSTGNVNNSVHTISVNLREGIVAIGGAAQKNPSNDGWVHAYFILRSTLDGDSIYAEKFANNPAVQINSIRQIIPRPYPNSTKLLVVGVQVIGNNPMWLRQYTADTLTGITHNGEVAENYFLSQNYPNPFNPNTKIEFSIPKKSFVSVKVYDVLGKEIQTLVNEIKNAGNYESVWSADNFSSGVYYYKLTTGDYTETKKMILIK